MGHVTTKQQVDQDGQPTSNMLLEITYGGHEAPFGGLDTSAPPAYIDPKCLTSTDGFIVVDNKLVLASFVAVTLPTLWGSNLNRPTPLKFGNYYDSIKGWLNYALGVTVTTPIGPPLYWTYKFYITVWDTLNNIVDNQTLNIKLWQNYIEDTKATLTFPVIRGEASDFSDSGQVGFNYGASGVSAGNVNFAYAPGTTLAQAIAGLVAATNAASASTLFTAAPTVDGYGITLTAVTAGPAGNNLCITDASGSSSMGYNPAYYLPFPNAGANIWTFLENGQDVVFVNSPSSFSNVSATAVGGTLYFANLGPMILKYQATGQFNISSMYAGVTILRKFAGSLIGLGTIPALGTVQQNNKMIFAWSAAENLDEWNPVDINGNVTGAGFAQLADIDDALNGLIVTNNTAFILRAQGISYATATGNGSDPFQFAHIGLGPVGEGAQNAALVAQYDQTGAYVGNAEIFQISGNIGAIGQKINTLFFSDLEDSTGPLGASVYACSIGDRSFPLLIFMINSNFYTYNAANKTWMFFSAQFHGQITLFLATLATLASADNVQVIYTGTIFYYSLVPQYTIQAYSLTEGVNTLTESNPAQLTFPQEELVFGRDVTIDALYIALWAKVTGVVTLNFYFNGVLFSQQVLDPAVFNTLGGNPVELQIFPTTMQVFTSHSPQLQITHTLSNAATVTGLRYAKIQMFASFDPNQRPV